jgi:tryptophan synthase beta subunit
MPKMNKDQHIVINVSGRGDKDLNSVVEIEDIKL